MRLESNMDATVCDRITWDGEKSVGNWGWSRSPMGRAIGELEELNMLISSVCLKPTDVDSWKWSLANNGVFAVKNLSVIIDDKLLSAGTNVLETLRNNLVPKKVEVFVWRARKKRLPSLTELDHRGIDLHSTRYPLCNDDVESVDHALMFCKFAFDVWCKVFDWWGINLSSSLSIIELFWGTSSITMSDLGSMIWQAVIWVSGYLIWRNRNQKVFNNKCWSPPVALCEIQVKTYEWIAKRCKAKDIDWHNWFHNPIVFVS
ncbi:uncharacterized protein [Rutidosis leptorrhynchoides]|uniref:uncharacterized protein n=1 Tax=Rutidosis leptorrhynchoides TaxID=125765 RepID=UPI003A9A4809